MPAKKKPYKGGDVSPGMLLVIDIKTRVFRPNMPQVVGVKNELIKV